MKLLIDLPDWLFRDLINNNLEPKSKTDEEILTALQHATFENGQPIEIERNPEE